MATEATTDRRIISRFREHPLFWLSLFFLLSRILLYQFVPFRFERINDFMQFLDPELLRGDLFAAVGHLHTQPPLHNLMVGLVLKIFPEGLQFHLLAGLYTLLSLGLILGLYHLLIERGVRLRIAWLTSALFALCPTLIWAERLPIYTLPIMVTLVLMGVSLQRYVRTHSPLFGFLFIAGTITLPLTRSFFHLLLWTLPLLGAFLFLVRTIDRKRMKTYALAALLGIALVGGWYGKNLAEYGSFTASTWQGMNLQGVVTLVPQENVQRLVEQGEVTPLALIPRFSSPGTYYRYYGRTPLREHPALDDTLRSTGYINWNNRIYAEAGKEYQRNALKIATHYPLRTAEGIVNQFYLFCSLRSYRIFHDPSRWWIPRTDNIVHLVQDLFLVYLVPLLIFFLIGSALFRFVRTFRHTINGGEQPQSNRPTIPVDLFIGFAILYTLIVSIIAELGEGNLMRVQIDPFLALTAGLIGERIATTLSSDKKKSNGRLLRLPTFYRKARQPYHDHSL